MLPAHLAGLITRTALFAHLDDAQQAALARQLHWMCLPGGQTLFRPGEPADALYLLCSGSLGVFDGPTTLVHQLCAGECVGEMSLLSGNPHRLAVRALRDSELLRLNRSAFEALVERHPGAMLDVARLAVERLMRREHHVEAPDKPRTFAILPVDAEVPARELAMKFARALEPFGHCAVIDARTGAERSSDWFAQREANTRFVIYLDTDGDPLWRHRCLRQADVLLLPARAGETAKPWPEAAPGHPSRARHRPRHLLLLHPAGHVLPGAARRWRAQFSGELTHHHLCNEDDFARVARLVSGHGRGL
ncbi:cyclic nucleotide-binding domain-containing protein, partial [Rhodanobacter sp. 115]